MLCRKLKHMRGIRTTTYVVAIDRSPRIVQEPAGQRELLQGRRHQAEPALWLQHSHEGVEVSPEPLDQLSLGRRMRKCRHAVPHLMKTLDRQVTEPSGAQHGHTRTLGQFGPKNSRV